MNRSLQRRERRGGALLELIICLPVFLIALFAIAEFGLLMANQQQLEYASRIGALNAAEMYPLPASSSTLANSEIARSIKRHLRQAGLDTSDAHLRITLEHNVGGGTTTLIADDGVGSGVLDCPEPHLPPAPTSREYVRVSVCMDVIDGKMTPNLLKAYGFDIQGRIAQQTTTLRWEPGVTP